jgi:RNA polymerase sigma factor for flagellar operon FliA
MCLIMNNAATSLSSETSLVNSPPPSASVPRWAGPSPERDQRIRDALPLVRHIAEELRRRYTLSMPFEDLYALGVTGLVRAMSRFDSSRQTSFTTFAYHRIRGAILDGLRRSDRQYSFDMRNRLRAERRANDLLKKRAADSPADPSASTHEKLADLESILSDLATIHIASSATSADAEAMTPDPDEEAHQRWMARRVQRAIESLPQKERQVVELYYYGDDSFGDIAGKLGMSRPWAYRLHERALVSLRAALADLAEEETTCTR